MDIIAVAKTGSGKTLGFLLPALHLLSARPRPAAQGDKVAPEAVVIAPTRELARQIEVEAAKFAGLFDKSLKSVCVYGGTPLPPQMKELKSVRPAIIIATPGTVFIVWFL